jgi:transposase
VSASSRAASAWYVVTSQKSARKAYLRVETEPGEQAQVDWGSFGQVRIGATQRPLSAFAMVPSWSRMLFIDFAFEQQADALLRMHQLERAVLAFTRYWNDVVGHPFEWTFTGRVLKS